MDPDPSLSLLFGENSVGSQPSLQVPTQLQPPFVPGGIHSQEVLAFWEHELKANAWVLDVIKHGYSLPFTSPPQPSLTKNNASARRNMDFVRQEVHQLHAAGIVEFVDSPPFIVSPLTVASNSANKLRLCLDVSRSVNQFLSLPKVVLADLKAALQITDPQDWQAVYDLSSAYFHIKIWEGHVKYLGAAFENPDGSIQYFRYLFLAFGISSAVHVMTKIMKPISAYFAQSGIKHTIYLDDGRVVAATRLLAQSHLTFVYNTLRAAGWTIALHKSDTIDSVSQIKNYLGFSINTDSMRVFLQPQKEKDLVEIVKSLISFSLKKVKTKFLAKVLGKMISNSPALGSIPLIFARQGYFHLEKTVEEHGWSSKILITEEISTSMKAFLSTYKEYDGHPILHSSSSISLLSLIGPPDNYFANRFIPLHIPDLPHEVLVSDASNVAVCAYSFKAQKDFFFIVQLSPKECLLSSGHRELLAVKYALLARQSSSPPSPSWTNVFWLTDSENLVVFLTKGSSKAPIQSDILVVLKIAKDLNLNLLPIHLKREDPRIKIADAGSRIRDSDDWSIDQHCFDMLNSLFGPFSIDIFADSSNAKTEKFFSDFICPGTMGVDAFAHSWDGQQAWICPPVSKIIKTLRHLSKSKLSGILIVPNWKTADFWPILFPSNKALNFIKQSTEIFPRIIQNQRACSPMVGKVPYNYLAVIIDSL